jgi:hypothetical protein
MTRPPDWIQTGRGRKELCVVAVFVLFAVGVPLAQTELYPFSRAPMFADAPRCYCNYLIFAPDRRALDPRDFGLQRNYWGNPLGVGAGFLPAETVDRFGEAADRETVTARVASCLDYHPELEFVEVVREVIGPRESGGVGLVRTDYWRVPNPFCRKGTGP